VRRGFLHSHSYTGNALACTAALATLEIFRDDNVLIANEQRAHWLAQAAEPIAAHPAVHHLRQQGMILAFDVEATPGFARRFHAHALAEGLLLRPIGNTVYWMPPYVLDEAQCAVLGARTLSALEKALAE
jgi:adenosylmethionine-8-amino-7-oxononanoate aminotransferase